MSVRLLQNLTAAAGATALTIGGLTLPLLNASAATSTIELDVPAPIIVDDANFNAGLGATAVPGMGRAATYPMTGSVSGQPGVVTHLEVMLYLVGVDHADDLDIVLVAPDGNACAFITRSAAVAGLAMSLGLGLAPSADAGPPGTWTTISGGGVTNTDEAGVHRTPDAALHVALVRDGSDGSQSIDVARISPSGRLVDRVTVVDRWEGVTDDPRLVAGPGGTMRLVFGGQAPGASGAPYTEGYLYLATSDPTGTVWSLPPEGSPAIIDPYGYDSAGTAAVTLADGSLASGFASGSTINYQVGAAPKSTFDIGGCCAYDLTFATDGTAVYAAWYSNAGSDAQVGEYVRQVHPTLGPVVKAPGSGSMSNGQHVALTARQGDGLHMAYCTGYPTCRNVVLWKVGSGAARRIPGSAGAQNIAMSAGPEGRLWVAFDDGSNDVHAVRTNRAATRFGALRTLRPGGSGSVYKVALEGSLTRADLVVNDGSSVLHQQVLAGLSLKAKPKKWDGSGRRKVMLKVTDAGDPVKGARVKATLHGKKLTCRTGSDGTCRITFPRSGRATVKVKASRSGYAPAVLRLKAT
jgi:hypothetical protein